ncbi:hypothetical protein A3D77_03790 [Candidatus Gottesmanbacteria bacterium RIFCSPHIGHO2_02_FULL_39_11]|uniref:Cell envelope-related transcriptional attenuator domain-containing protein n=1 Tax=Candidatus Gottesmanbacteria bacterium RIFCSPHIGHO2_02_FULL_39_11 TaxID=1798382 RepID=A0A1F5ZX50_9BACT|nr:MAG: hypothetical protein A3D77_03790 [Candidatus Gottesmanbacteria bacterium RIFCSPHIGHO2_02_FULL_39_11]
MKYKKVIAVFLILVFVSLYLLYQHLSPYLAFAQNNHITPGLAISLLRGSGGKLKTTGGRTNVVLFGIGGGNHDGDDLTDTILFISIDYPKKDIVMSSIPRDLYMDDLKDRINIAYHVGEKKQKGNGFHFAKGEIEKIMGVPIHYAYMLDFNEFKQIIDTIGGIDVDVPQSFTDTEYPIDGKENDPCGGDPGFKCRYETITFLKGPMHMDGTTALKFSRSRHAEGEEGTDYARSSRQQIIILAIKQKVQKLNIWKNLTLAKSLLDQIQKMTKSDMDWSERLLLYRFFTLTNLSSIRRFSINEGDPLKKTPGLLVNPPMSQYEGAWVLIPRTGNFNEIHDYVKCNLDNSECSIKLL